MKYKILFVIGILIFSISCNNDDDSYNSNEVNDFVWKGLNSWYYWQPDVETLNDERGNTSSYLGLINQYQNPNNFFYSLLNNYPITDRFSWIVSDYDVLLNSFQGTGTSLGFDFGLVRINNTNDLYGYVRYVLPNSNTNIVRGDIFTKVNGTQLNISNYVNLLYGGSTITLGLADYVNGSIVDNTIEKQVTPQTYSEDPVYYTNLYEIGSKKIGYLVYNGFTFTYNQELNNAFSNFATQNITDFVLDLRYNGGGSVATASYLASMLKGSATGNIFASLQFNAKHQSQNRNYNFSNEMTIYDKNTGNSTGTQSINSINLSKIYVLTTYSTASASELIINGLKPYMEVVVIGKTTRGKDVGSITLFDDKYSDYTNKNNANPSHKYAMQPIVFKSFNANNEGNYSDGFIPDTEINELDYLDDFKPLGDPQEIMLQTAINQITGAGRFSTRKNIVTKQNIYKDFKDSKSAGKDMYIFEDK